MSSFAATTNRITEVVNATTDGSASTILVIENDKNDIVPGATAEVRLGSNAEWDRTEYPYVLGSADYTSIFTGSELSGDVADFDFTVAPGTTVTFDVDGTTVTLNSDYTSAGAHTTLAQVATDIATDIDGQLGAAYTVVANGARVQITKTTTIANDTASNVGAYIAITNASSNSNLVGVSNGTTSSVNYVPGTGETLTATVLSNDTLSLVVNGASQAALNGLEFRVPVEVNFNGVAEGTQSLEIIRVTGGISATTHNYAVVGASSVTMRTTQKTKISRSGNQAVTMVIDEVSVDSFRNADKHSFRLPSGFTWGAVSITGGPARVDRVADRELTVEVVSANNSRLESIFISAEIIPSRTARFGDVDVVVTQGNITPRSLVVAEYVDYEGMVRVDKVLDVVSGRNEENLYVAKVIIEEPVAGTFLQNRFMEFSFNRSQASLQNDGELRLRTTSTLAASIDASSSPALTGSGATSSIDTTDKKDGDKWDVRIDTATSGNQAAGRIELEIPFVVSAAFEGDLELTVKGAGVPEQTVVIAEAKKPVTVEIVDGTTAELVVGLQKQSAPEIIITETEAGALQEVEYTLRSSSTYEINWDDAKIEVIEGNLELDEDSTESVAKGININVDRRSTTPSKIKISGVQVTLDRTVPFGPFNVSMNFGNVKADHDRLSNNVGSKAYFNVVTPVQDGQRLTAVFTIGDANYTVNGEVMTLDAAPFISNNRTMLPIGTIAQVVGASVNYSPVTRTAIFTKDGVVVSMTLDQPFLTANGVVIPMDSAPVVVNSRAFVPMAFVAQAFGVPVQYDAAARTVTDRKSVV